MTLRNNIVVILAFLTVAYFSQGLLFERPEKRITTTDSKLALGNLESQILSASDLINQFPNRDDYKRSLFNLISTKISFLGNFSDFEILEKLAFSMLKDDTGLYYRAKYYSIIHEFELSNEIIEKINSKNSYLVKKIISSNQLALSRDLNQLKKQQELAIKNSNQYSDFLTMAEIEGELGNFDLADKHYLKAISVYKDTSPFVPAYLYFRRGVMWGEKADNAELALKYYNEAVHYLPEYVTAQVHRAELVSRDEAIKALRKVIISQDPEPKGVLAEYYLEVKRKNEANKLIQLAKNGYNNFLNNYKKAFADHASEFFSSVGNDAKKSLALSKVNYESRKTQRALMLLIESSLNAESKTDLCFAIEDAKKRKVTNIVLKELILENSC